MTASIDAVAPTVAGGSIRELSRVSALFALRFEDRPPHARRGRRMPSPLARHFDLDPRPGPRIRRGDGGDRDVPFQQRRPATARGPTDLTIARVQWNLLPPRLGGRLRRKAHVPVETLHRLPVNLESDRAACGTAPLLLEERLPPDERTLASRNGPIQAQLQRRVPFRGDDRLPPGHVFDPRQDEPRLDPRDVEGQHPGRGDVLPPPLLHDAVPHTLGPF